MRRNLNYGVLALVCAFALGCSDKKTTGENEGDKGTDAAKSVDTSFIPADAVAVIVAHPAKIMESEALQGAPLEEFLGDFKRGTGLDPKDIEQFVFPISPGFKGRPAFVIRTKKPYDKETIGGVQFSGERRREVEHDGKKYLQSVYTFKSWSKSAKNADEKGTAEEEEESVTKPTGQAMYLVDDTTLIAGDEESLKKMISAEKADSKLIKQLKAAKMHDIVILADITDSREKLKDMVNNGPGDRSQEDQLAKWAAEHAETASFWADVSPKLEFNLSIDSDDETGGAQLKKYIDEQISKAKGAINEDGEKILKDRRSPFKAELADKILKLANDSLAAVSIQDEGKMFVVTFTAPENAVEVIKEVFPALVEAKKKERREYENMKKGFDRKDFKEDFKKESNFKGDDHADFEEKGARDEGDFDTKGFPADDEFEKGGFDKDEFDKDVDPAVEKPIDKPDPEGAVPSPAG